jgi:hypothetical protein
MHRRAAAELGEILIHRRAGFPLGGGEDRRQLVVFRQREADDGRSPGFHRLDHLLHDLVDLGVALFIALHAGHDADARAFQGIRLQPGRIAARSSAGAECGDRILGVIADHDVEQNCRVLHRAGDRADLVLRVAVRHHAGAADQAPGRADADQAGCGSGRADRLAGIAARSEHREVGRNRRRGPAAGTARRTGQVIRVEDLAAEAADGYAAARELLQVGFREDEGSGLAHPVDRERVGGRYRVLHRDIAAGGRHVEGIEVVLEDDRDAMQRTDGAFAVLELLVHLRRDAQSLGVDGDDGAQGRTLLVVGFDAGKVALDQSGAGEPLARECGVDALNGGFLENEGLCFRLFILSKDRKYCEEEKRNALA